MPKTRVKIQPCSPAVACADLWQAENESASRALPSFPACAEWRGTFVGLCGLHLDLEGLWPGPAGLVPHIGGTRVFSTAPHLELSRSGARLKGVGW